MTGEAPGSVVLLYTTWPDHEGAEQAAQVLLREGRIACANILPVSTSVFRWEGEIRNACEVIALFKTTTDQASRTEARLSQLHPYQTPCILALAVTETGSSSGFLSWIADETRPQ